MHLGSSASEHKLQVPQLGHSKEIKTPNFQDAHQAEAFFKRNGIENDPKDLTNELVCSTGDVLPQLTREMAEAGVKIGVQYIKGKTGEFYSLRRFLDVTEDEKGETRYVDRSWLVKEGSNEYAMVAALHSHLGAEKKERESRADATHQAVENVLH